LLLIATVVGAAAAYYLWVRLQGLRPATIHQAEAAVREAADAVATLARLIVMAADVVHAFGAGANKTGDRPSGARQFFGVDVTEQQEDYFDD
jgi:hypothetical protein